MNGSGVRSRPAATERRGFWRTIGDWFRKRFWAKPADKGAQRAPVTHSDLRRIARGAESSGQWRAAIDSYAELTRAGEPGSDAIRLARLLERDDRLRAIQTYLWIAERHGVTGRPNFAIGPLTRVIELDPLRLDAREYLGDAYAALGMYRDAEKHYRLAADAQRARGMSVLAEELEDRITRMWTFSVARGHS